MEKIIINNVKVVKWPKEDKKGIVVISHGMAEHIERYDYFATKLNKAGYEVYGVHQLGHGDAIVDDLKGHWEKTGFNDCVENIEKVVKKVKKEKVPVFLFGHSMGSFIAQAYIQKYSKDIDGVILSGSAKTGFLHKMGNIIASLSLKDLKKPNTFLNALSFGSYNKAFKPNRTEYDWLSRDEKQVDKYVDDPLCGYVCTTGFFKSFLKALAHLNDNTKEIRKDLPIYIMSGDHDPVGNNSKDVIALSNMYKELEIKDVEMILYKDGRHEMLNEINKDEVIKNIVNWFKKHI